MTPEKCSQPTSSEGSGLGNPTSYESSVNSFLITQMTFLLRWLLVLSVPKRQVCGTSILESRILENFSKQLHPWCLPRSIPLDSRYGKSWHPSLHVARLGPTQLRQRARAEKDLIGGIFSLMLTPLKAPTRGLDWIASATWAISCHLESGEWLG